MGDGFDLQRDLELIRSVADRSVMDIEAAGREAEAEIRRQASTAQEAQPQRQAKPVLSPASEFEEDDYYQFRQFRR